MVKKLKFQTLLTKAFTLKIFSGYRFPWMPFFNGAPKFHDDHHRLFKYNYGTLGILDYIHGTLAPSTGQKILQ